MKLRKIEVRASRTIQVEQYEPFTLDIVETYEVTTTDRKEVEKQRRRLTTNLTKMLHETMEAQADVFRR